VLILKARGGGMNVYLISQYENTGFNTYDTAVVIAESKEAAGLTHPSSDEEWSDGSWRIWKTSK
jgi:hypothetical protein